MQPRLWSLLSVCTGHSNWSLIDFGFDRVLQARPLHISQKKKNITSSVVFIFYRKCVYLLRDHNHCPKKNRIVRPHSSSQWFIVWFGGLGEGKTMMVDCGWYFRGWFWLPCHLTPTPCLLVMSTNGWKKPYSFFVWTVKPLHRLQVAHKL